MKQLKFEGTLCEYTSIPKFALYFSPWDSPFDYPDLDAIKHLFYTELK